MKTKFILFALAGVTAFSSCSKDDEEETPTPTATANPTASTYPSPSDSDGNLIAVNSRSTVSGFTITIGTAVAVFPDGSGNNNDAGTVQADNNTLDKQPNNSYVYTPGTTNPTGITFGSSIVWTGGGTTNVPTFTLTNNDGMPTVADINSGTTASKATGYTLSTTSISNSDSVLFILGDLSYIAGPNTLTHTFSSSDMASLGNGTNISSIAPYKMSSQTVSGKKFYLINETVVQQQVTVQD